MVVLRKLYNIIRPKRDSVEYEGTQIPSPDLRWCGPEFKNDAFYVASAESEAKRLIEHFSCDVRSAVLDIGCGQGRLAIGLSRVIGPISYLGLDVHQASIDWCKKYIGRSNPSFRFDRIDIRNERYNPMGKAEAAALALPEGGLFDVCYLYSVFSHMSEVDMRGYLKHIKHALRPSGGLFFTTFVETGVAPVTINPPNYIFEKSVGELHVVRYEKNHLFALLKASGFDVFRFDHGVEADTQSAIYARKSAD